MPSTNSKRKNRHISSRTPKGDVLTDPEYSKKGTKRSGRVNDSMRLEKDSEVLMGSNCALCDEPDSSNMVQCDRCDSWYHFICVDVTGGISEKDWICGKCEEAELLDKKRTVENSAELSQPQRETNSKLSKKSNRRQLEIQLLRLEEDRKLKEKFALRKLAIEEELEQQFQDKKINLLQGEASDSSEDSEAGFVMPNSRIEKWINDVDTYQEPSCSSKDGRNVSKHGMQSYSRTVLSRAEQQANGTIQRMDQFNPGQRSTPNGKGKPGTNQLTSSVEPNSLFLHRSQLAARQAVPKELPDFNGDPEDWPLFLSMFNSSTQMCGFSNEENMLRLRKCLKGQALEAVRCRLLHLSNVNGVMSTLRMLFGRPEALIHAITLKIRSLPSPDIDRLETLINFALSVENLCATIEACELEDFMYNAALRYELIAKLPSHLRLDWAKHSRRMPSPKLSDYSSWLYSMAEDASSVLATAPTQRKPRFGRKEDRYLNVHADNQPPSDISPTRSQQQRSYSKQWQSDITGECTLCHNNCSSLANCDTFKCLNYETKWSILKDRRLCKMCLHRHGGTCRQRKECGTDGCQYMHHSFLHKPNKGVTHNSEQATTKKIQIEQNCHLHQSQSNEILFRIVPVTLYGPSVEIQTYAFLDDGSELTLIEDSLAHQLQLTGQQKPLCLKWTGGTRRVEESSRMVDLSIAATNNNQRKYRLSCVRTVKELQLPHQTLIMEELNKKFTHLQGLPIGTYYHAVPRILIGLDHASLGYALEGREGAINEPVAVKTRLGWTVYGSSNQNPSTYQFVNHHSTRVRQCDCKTDEDLHNSMKEYFSLDSMGVVKPATCLLPSTEQRAQDILNKTTRRIDGQYEVGLLWKYDNVRLPDSQAMAMRRWKCLQQRLTKDEELASVLDEKFQDYLQKQYIRKLSPEELSAHQPRSWYLPIFPVMNPNKPNKVRLVWDAAAKAHGVSLNSHELNSVLLTGPDRLTPLLTVLNKFREFRVGITGDIREMYHQVLIRDVDQHCQRFLWRADKKDIEPSVFVLRVMTFGACCSPSSAQHVKNLNAMEYEQQYPVAVDAIVRRHYVDDMLTSLETEDEAIQLARDVKWIHDKGGFEIRNWISNSSRVLDALREGVTEQKSLRLGSETATEKVLGMYWCTTSNTFTYRLSTQHDSELLMGVRPSTKREALRTLMRVYDPLGLIGHVLIYLKVLMQEVWRSRTGWDDPIDENSYRKITISGTGSQMGRKYA
ncbi:uncharacterized protein LOC131438258 [Malaya genurostris]|uniref:uncharacterized protein LOC131438258 n=1 Tax=Malaya genurostris TaxID=325434 RepID=UPI0026F3B73B|nr:uncharacterized protein LOC131438258 [Malaya genurostris]